MLSNYLLPSNRRIIRRKAIVNENGIQFVFPPCISLPILKNVSMMIGTFLTIVRIHNRPIAIVCDALCVSASLGAHLAACVKRIPFISIVTDIPEVAVPKTKQSFGARLFRYCVEHSDGFLFLTEYMRDYFTVGEKPSVVMEGHVDEKAAQQNNILVDKSFPRVCMFAGNLVEENGLKYMIDGFLEAELPDTVLEIYGAGKLQEHIIGLSRKNANIRYCGSLPNDEVVAAETKATLLINPRPSDQVFTKYSFPSKNLEYMASGTPLLTTKLPCIPTDQFPYLYFLEDESSHGVAEKLKYIFSLSPDDLYQFGLSAKEYVVREKNNVTQAKKLINMIENSFYT